MQAAWKGLHACVKRLKLPRGWYEPRCEGEALQAVPASRLDPGALGSDMLLIGASHAIGL